MLTKSREEVARMASNAYQYTRFIFTGRTTTHMVRPQKGSRMLRFILPLALTACLLAPGASANEKKKKAGKFIEPAKGPDKTVVYKDSTELVVY